MATSHLNIQIPDNPTEMVTSIVAYAGIAKRLHVELASTAAKTGIDLDAIKNDLINEAKKTIPHGDFAKEEIKVYNTMFEAIETIFAPMSK